MANFNLDDRMIDFSVKVIRFTESLPKSNPMIDQLYQTAMDNGASGGKISGAGGGGFILFYCPDNARHKVIKALSKFGGVADPYEFTVTGLKSWSI